MNDVNLNKMLEAFNLVSEAIKNLSKNEAVRVLRAAQQIHQDLNEIQKLDKPSGEGK